MITAEQFNQRAAPNLPGIQTASAADNIQTPIAMIAISRTCPSARSAA